MPIRLLRYCAKCLHTQHAVTRQMCESCGGPLLPLLDEHGAISRDFLIARARCCDTGCRNCPYDENEPAGDSCRNHGQQKTCSRCGAAFQCRSDGHCWCVNLRLSPATLQWLERNFGDCLCPTCLAEYAMA